MKQLVILSGKGGTGKTSVAAAFAHLFSLTVSPFRTVLADADVDASNLELVLSPKIISREDFKGGIFARIDSSVCTGCGICEQVCRFDAITSASFPPLVDTLACEGCAACLYQCPENAIIMHDQVVGECFHSESCYGPLFHAALRPAQENSGKLVTLVKQQACQLASDQNYDLLLVDGPPGIGCPVISATSGADLALIVTEATAAGIHDMQRVLETAKHFNVQPVVCINKADIYPEGVAEIETFCHEQDVPIIGQIPFDTTITEAMVQGQPVTVYDPLAPASRSLRDIWTALVPQLGKAQMKKVKHPTD